METASKSFLSHIFFLFFDNIWKYPKIFSLDHGSKLKSTKTIVQNEVIVQYKRKIHR